MLAGTVEEANHNGKLYYVKLRLGSGDDAPSATVVSARDPQLDADDQAMVLGSIVDQPEDNLAGYEGADASVIWSGMALKLPAPEK